MGSTHFGHFMPKRMVLDLAEDRKLPLVAPDLQDVADGEDIVGKPYDEWWTIRTRTVIDTHEEDDTEDPPRWKAGDDVFDENGKAVAKEITERTTTIPIMSMICWLMARKADLTAEQIEKEEWPWTLKQFRRQIPFTQFASKAGDVMLFFYSEYEAAIEVEADPQAAASVTPDG
jgi:hypothetical protein